VLLFLGELIHLLQIHLAQTRLLLNPLNASGSSTSSLALERIIFSGFFAVHKEKLYFYNFIWLFAKI
jgi:hypothetical protein